MCGLAGACSPSGIDPAVLPAMGDAIRHRGPDGEGYLLYGPERGARVLRSRDQMDERDGSVTVGFAHRRLTIIDLSEASDQPMIDDSGELTIAYNGELYNYLELRDELESLGRPARTSGDTEVVLNAYAEWGPACLERMVGMWALAILDLRRRVLFLALDRFGIKPLFYTLADGTLYFGSEIKALLAAPDVRPEPQESAVRKFLLTGRVDQSPETFFSGIRRLPPAHHVSIPLGAPISEPSPERYWEYPSESFKGSRRAAAAEFKRLLSQSVRVHLRSDVPVGTCLSGGLDSSGIVCLADELRREGEVPRYPHSGFGYLPDDPSVSERPFMEEVVGRTGIEMTYVEPTPERFQSALLEIIRQQDEPFGTTSIAAQWFVFEAAHRARLKVMLDGQGADEVLGGYHSYFASIGLAHLRARRPLRYALFNRQYRRRVGTPVVPRELVRFYMSPDRDHDPPPTEVDSNLAGMELLSAGLRARCRPEDIAIPDFKSINEILEAHTARLGLPSLLRFEDRNSMAHSIEARVPFLDHRLVEFAFSLPGSYKVKGLETKDVLRRALRGTLPEPIRARNDKIGFRAEPTATWALAERNRDSLLANQTEFEESWFDRAGLEGLMNGAGRSDQAEFLLWRVLNTKLWLRSFWGDGGAPLST
jgi:asparagine synthase (glutamine-hydrolysing)